MKNDSTRSDRLKRLSSLMKSEPNLSKQSNQSLITLNSSFMPLSKPMPLVRPVSASKRSITEAKRPISGSVRPLSSQRSLSVASRPKSAKGTNSISNESLSRPKKSVSFINAQEKSNDTLFKRCPTPAASVTLGDLQVQEASNSITIEQDQRSLIEIVHDEALIEESEDFYARLENENEYFLTPFQTYIYDELYPNSDDPKKLETDGSRLYIARAVRLKQEIIYADLKLAVNRVVSLYPILETVFFRNEKILDADVVGTLPRYREWDSESDLYLEKINTIQNFELQNSDPEILADFTTKWMRGHLNFNNLFKVLFIPSDQNLNISDTLVFIGANIVLDSLSVAFLSQEIMNLYSSIAQYRKMGIAENRLINFLSNYKVKEKASFLQFSQGCVDSRFSMDFWRTQCMEAVQETVEFEEREEFLKQIKKLGIEKYNLEGSKDSLTKRMGNLSNELKNLLQQRKKLDSGMNGEGPMTHFTDPTTNEVMTISVDAKDALLQSVLGIEGSNTESVVSFLDKHGVPKDVQRKINASSLPIETFSELNQQSLANVPILARERRKILALAEYVSSRIRESFHEQHKIKGNYERRILKTRRDLEKVNDMLAVVKERLEINDDMNLRLNAIINPPIFDERILPLNLNTVTAGNYNSGINFNQTAYSFVPFTVKDEVVVQLRNFREAYLLSKQNSAGGKDSGSSSVEIITSDESDSEKFNEKTQTHNRKLRNANSVCMAAFCVLLRHISGQDKFSIGLTQSYRYRDMLVGPVSDTVPLKIDLTKKRLEFRSLFSKMYRGMYHALHQGAACPLYKIAKKYSHVGHLPIRFEYISYKDFQRWQKAGITIEDLMDESVNASNKGLGFTKLWTLNESDPFDLKLVLVETKDSIEGGFVYRPEKFTPSQITKWMIKFQSILSSIEYSQRKIRISTMISRYF